MEGYLLGGYMGLEEREGRGNKQAKKKIKKIILKNKCDHIICTMKIYVINTKLHVYDILKCLR